MRMTTLKTFRYGGRVYEPGDTLDLPDKWVRPCTAFGYVREHADNPKAPTPKAAPAPAKAESKAEPASVMTTDNKGGRYLRRDMRAKE